VCSTEMNRATVTPYGVTGEELRVQGEQRVIFTIHGDTYTHDFCVCMVATEADAILGTDFLLKMDARLDFENGKFCLKRTDKVGHDHPKGEHCESQGTVPELHLRCFPIKKVAGNKDLVGLATGHGMCGSGNKVEKLNPKLS